MGWIKKVPPPHACNTPWKIPLDVWPGSVWGCTCGKQYEYMGTKRDYYYYGDIYPKWEELIP